MWELDHHKGWVPKNQWFWTVVLEKTLENPSYCREIKSVNNKGNQSQIFIVRTDAETDAPILWPPDTKNWLIRKDWFWQRLKVGGEGDDRGKHGQMAYMCAKHVYHWLNGHEFEQAPGDGEGQGSLVCCSPWGHKIGHQWATEKQVLYNHCLWQPWICSLSWGFGGFGGFFWISLISEIIVLVFVCLCLTWLSLMLSRPSMLSQMAGFPSFYDLIIFCSVCLPHFLKIHSSLDKFLSFPCLGFCK